MMQQPEQKKNVYDIFMKSALEMKIDLHITEIGKQLKQNLERKIVANTEGKCIAQGFIRPRSVRILSYSSGNVFGDVVSFYVAYECDICHPAENMHVDCIAKTITKAGVHAEVVLEDGVVPLTIFIARDHNYANRMFSRIGEGDKIKVSIVGIRYELNDPYISSIAKLIDYGTEKRVQRNPGQPKRIEVLDEPDEYEVDAEEI